MQISHELLASTNLTLQNDPRNLPIEGQIGSIADLDMQQREKFLPLLGIEP
jgi:hypothetical protein